MDAWIISHPHRDHAGAFNEIMADPGDIVVKQIYDNGFDYDFIMAAGEPYDDITGALKLSCAHKGRAKCHAPKARRCT